MLENRQKQVQNVILEKIMQTKSIGNQILHYIHVSHFTTYNILYSW